MKVDKERIFLFLKRSSSRVFIVAGIILIAALYHDHYYSKTFFRFPAKAKIVKQVSEQGTIVFATGVKLDLENHYISNETVTAKGSTVKIEGTIEGDIDPHLKPVLNSDKYSALLNVLQGDQRCDDKFAMQYPSFLRRFVYYMPSSPVFNGQTWQITSCQGQFVCNYSILQGKDRRTVEMLCSGRIGDADIAMTGDIKINRKFDGFSLIILDIVAQSPEMVSTWKFSENSKPG
jgi:hypothetical protein